MTRFASSVKFAAPPCDPSSSSRRRGTSDGVARSSPADSIMSMHLSALATASTPPSSQSGSSSALMAILSLPRGPSLLLSSPYADVSAQAIALPAAVASPEYLRRPPGAATSVASDTVPTAADPSHENPESAESAPLTSDRARNASSMPAGERCALSTASTFIV